MSARICGLAMLVLVLACETPAHPGPLVAPQVPPPAPRAEPAASPQAAVPPERPSPQRTWHLAARVEVDEGDDIARLRLFTTADGTVFVTSRPLVMPVGTDGSLAPDRASLRGIDPPDGDARSFDGIAAWDVETLGGRPGGLYLSLRVEVDGRAEPPTQQVYRRADIT